MSDNPRRFYEFGPFRLDTAGRRLLRETENGEAGRREWEEVQLQRKVFDVLLSLVRQSRDLASRDKVLDEVWRDTHVEPHRVTANISTLRQALGDDRNNPRYIRTVPGEGYRFIADVREVVEEPVAVVERTRATLVLDEETGHVNERTGLPPANESMAVVASPRAGAKAGRKLRPLALGAAVIVLCVALAASVYYLRAARPEPAAPPKSIAVLPFKPLVAGERDESLEMGMADSLIARLGSLHGITVRPVSSVRRYTGLQQDAVAAGRELAVSAVLDGSIQRQGDGIRVTVRLLSVPGGAQLWAEQFDEKFTDIFGVQDAISARVADALALKLSGPERESLARHATENTEAYQLYLKGRFYWIGDRTEERLRKSLQYFSQAIEVDPNYAPAHAGLADVYVVLGTYYVLPPREAFDKAKSSAERALKLDERLAEAHAALSVVKLWYEWDWAGYEAEVRRAIELKPSYAIAHAEYAQFLAAAGRFDEAKREAKRAQEIDPLSTPINTTAGWVYYFARDYDEAIRRYREVIEIYPDSFEPHRRLGLAYFQMKRNEEALAEIERSRALAGENAEEIAYLGYAYGVAGRRAEAGQVLEELRAQAQRRYVSPYLVALVHIGLGDRDQAFAWLEKAYEDRAVNLIFLKVEPLLDPLRADPRFAALLRRVNLP